MKKFYLMALCAAVAAFTGCEQKIPVPAPEAEFLAYFGFEACEGVFPEAVRVDEPEASGVIEFTTPVGTEADAYKALVPVFETTSPDAVVTDAEGNVIESGKPFDFSKDVDIYVTMTNEGGETSTMYTVSVKAKAALTWTLLAETTEEAGYAPFMAINPKDGMPYVASRTASATGYYPMAYKISEGAFAPVVGNSPIFREFRTDEVSLGFDKNGVVYTAFRDYEKGTTADLAKTSVMKLDGTPSFVGEQCAIVYPREVTAIFPKSSNDIWVAFTAGKQVGNVASRCLELAQWNGSAWTTEMEMPGRTASDYAYYVEPVHAAGVDYMFVYNQNSHSVSLYKLGDNGWSTVVEGLKFNKADGTAGTEKMLNLRSLDCDVASNGDVYFMVGCQFVTEAYNVAVVRYRPSDQSQTIIGGVTDRDIDDDRYFSMALDAFDTPYLAYRNAAENKLYIQYIDNKTKTWSTPAAVSACTVEDMPTIRFNEAGVGYIAAYNEDNKHIQMYIAE